MAARYLLRLQPLPLRFGCMIRQMKFQPWPLQQHCYCSSAAPQTSTSTPSASSSSSPTSSSQSSTQPSSSQSSSVSSSTTSTTATSTPTTAVTPSSGPAQDKAVTKATSMNPVLDVGPNDEDGFRERFIPLSRRSLIRELMQEDDFLTDAERRRFEEFAIAMDNAISKQYHGVLAELKQLFDPVNPDKDTIANRLLGKREKEDSEFWLMQKLQALMESANFHELPSHVVKKALDEHMAGEGVNVSVNPKNYQTLRFWALGKELPADTTPWYTRLSKSAFYKASKRSPPAPVHFYKRIVVAVKPKGQDKLMLKMFKEIPTGAIEQLLPDGKIKMSAFDQGLLMAMASIGSLSLLMKAVTFLADIQLQWTLIAATAAGIFGLRGWNSYKNRRTRYMMQLSKTLYFKNVANNRGLLALVVDRAQDESFKECLLAYTFLLTNRPDTVREAANSDPTSLPPLLGGISGSALDKTVEQWVQERTGATISFNSKTARSILEDFGILYADQDDDLAVLPLDAALLGLPRQPASMATRTEEVELEEGYDKIFSEEEKTYKKEEKLQRRHGWS
ncbi:transmembrane protein 143-like isoform X2 [Lytechinus variegatus]|uniref:transmembrane protein 143-like isoform X2 n=1 Tax=Lytechinus variegatus TaxID=7654 RepID=UPI001BB299B5|nr:transmembrane protein 143-like isoform X2 [Lytechinus variegatus]